MSARLGTLTLDLVAKTGSFLKGTEKSRKAVQKFAKDARKSANEIGKNMASASIAVTAATAGIILSTTKAANEIDRLAKISGTSTTDFQKYAAGAKALGIEQDKLSDIFKDTNDKIGDFVQTGGGALADFFENIAPQVGVTAEQFKNLSGADALGLYVSSLEKANVSQNEMTFFMEAIASDATLLLPLLKNGGEGFKAYGDAAEKMGGILDEKAIKAAKEFNDTLLLGELATKGIKNQIGTALLPVVNDLAVSMFVLADNTAEVDDFTDGLTAVFKGAAKAGVGLVGTIDLVGKSIGGLAALKGAATEGSKWYDIIPTVAVVRAASNWKGIKKTLDVVGEDLDETAQKYADAMSAIDGAGSGEGEGNDSLDRIRKLREEAEKLKAELGKGSAATKKDFDLKNAANDAIAAYEKQIELAEDATEQEKLLYEVRKGSLVGINKEQQEKLESLAKEIDGLEQLTSAQEAYADLVKSQRTDSEQELDTLREKLSVLEAIKFATDIDDDEKKEQRSRAIAGAFTSDAPGLGEDETGLFDKLDSQQKAQEKWYESELEKLKEFRENKLITEEEYDELDLERKKQHEEAMGNIEKARRDAALSGVSDLFGSIATATENGTKKQRKIAKAAAIAQAVINTYLAAQSAYASAAQIPIVGWIAGPIAAAAAVAAGLANVSKIKGQAHDGIDYVPTSGTWNLEKGERVVTNKTSKKLDATLDEIRGGGTTNNSSRNSNVTNNITLVGGDDGRRTASQIANETMTRQQIAQARFG